MKGLDRRTVAYYVLAVSFGILLALKGDDLRRQIVAGPVPSTQLVDVESLPSGSYVTTEPGALPAGLAWSPDSRLLTVPTEGEPVQLYDGETGALIRAMGKETGGATEIAWSFDGAMLAATGYEADLEYPEDGQPITRIWSADGTQKAAIPGKMIAWANRSNHILIAPYDGGEHVWLTQLLEVTADGQTTLQSEFEMERWRVAVSPDDHWVVTEEERLDPTAEDPRRLKLVVREFETRRVVAELGGADMSYIETLAWSPDGAWLAALYYYDCPLKLCARLEVWDTETWQSYKTFGRLPYTSRTISWSADSRWIAAGVSPTRFALTLYPLDEQQMIRELDHPLTEGDVVSWAPDGRKLATTSFESYGPAIIWQADALLP